MSENLESISCNFDSEEILYLAYMPFIKDGGLFIRTKNTYELGTPLSLTIQLLDDTENHSIEGRVIWVTPKGAQGNKPTGVGVQFIGENSRVICNKIETCLAGMLKSNQMTDTM